MFHFSVIAHGLLAVNHEIGFRAVTLKLPITSPPMAVGRDLLLAFLEPQYKLSSEHQSFQTPEIFRLTNRVKKVRHGKKREMGIPLQLQTPVMQRVSAKPRGLWLGGREDRCLAAWLGTTDKGRCSHWGSLSANTRGMPSIFKPLERKEMKLTFSGPLLIPGTMQGSFAYLISFNPHSNLGSRCCPLL